MRTPTWHTTLPLYETALRHHPRTRVLSYLAHARVVRMRLTWLFGALFITTALALIHVQALTHFLYWKYLWLDIPMHALGGIAIGALVAPLISRRHTLWFFLSCATLFIAWEVFEYVGGISEGPNFIPDTTLDLIMDTIGCLLPYVLARKLLWRSA